MAYWLMKSEPDAFSIDDLQANSPAHWDGVRNYQARNFMQQMKIGDDVLFYHSSCKKIGLAGFAKVVKEAYPDHTAFDPNSDYFDAKSQPEQPRWFMVDVAYSRHTKQLISLDILKSLPAFEQSYLTKKGARLSVMPITEVQWQAVLELERS